MTTIIATKNKLVSDSKVTLGKGYFYSADKIIKVKGMLIGAAGLAGDCSRFLEWAKDDFKAKSKPKFEAIDPDDKFDGLIVMNNSIHYFCQEYPQPEKINAEFYGVGSGSKAARAAMIMGATPEQAVEIACQVDDFSGLPLQILTLE